MSIGSTIFSTDWLPPILIKESRQFVRSRLVIWVLCLELLGLAAYTAFFLRRTSLGPAFNGWTDAQGLGARYLPAVALALTLALAAVAWDGLQRTAKEDETRCGEMMGISGLTPWQHAWGKVASGWIFGLLVLSTGIPFLVLAYQMRGVSLMTLAQVITQLLAKVLMLVPLALVVAKLPLPFLLRSLGGAVSLGYMGVWMMRSQSYYTPHAELYSGLVGTVLGWFCNDGPLLHNGIDLVQFAVLAFWMLLAGLIFLRFSFAPPLPGRWRLARWQLLLLYAAGTLWWWRFFGGSPVTALPSRILFLQILVVSVVLLVLALYSRPFWGKDRQSGEGLGQGLLWLLPPFGLFLGMQALLWGWSRGTQEILFMTVLWEWLALSAVLGWLFATLAARHGRHLQPLLTAAVIMGFSLVSILERDHDRLESRCLYQLLALVVMVGFARLLPPLAEPGSPPAPAAPAVPKPQRQDAELLPKPDLPRRERHVADHWLLRWLGRHDTINPVFLQELRQLARHQVVFWLFWLLVAIAALLTIVVYYVGNVHWQLPDECSRNPLCFQLGWLVLTVPPLILLARCIQESEEQEMLFTTPLRVDQIRRAKVAVALISSLLLWLPLAVVRLLAGLAQANQPDYYGEALLPEFLMFSLETGIKMLVLSSLAVAFAWSPVNGHYRRWLGGAIIILLASPALSKIAFLAWAWLSHNYQPDGDLSDIHVMRPWLALQLFMLLLCLLASYLADRWRRKPRLFSAETFLVIAAAGFLVLFASRRGGFGDLF